MFDTPNQTCTIFLFKESMLPVRCFTCNNVIGHLWKPYMERRQVATGHDALNELGMKRICCRRMLLGHVCVIDDILIYSGIDHTLDECNTQFNCYNGNTREVQCD